MLLDNSIEEPCATELPTPSLYLLVSVLLYETNISNTISVTIPISSVWKQIYFYSEKKKPPSNANTIANTSSRHVQREPDLASHIDLKLHLMTRSERPKRLVKESRTFLQKAQDEEQL